jgi:hypothetical protein
MFFKVFKSTHLLVADFVWTDDWLELREHQYKYFADKHSTAESSKRECHKNGGMLVSINDREEADFVTLTVLKKRTLSVFIGGVDQGELYVYV